MPQLAEQPRTITPAPAKPAPVEDNGQAQAVKVFYPNFEAIACVGDRAITYEKMKQILGWQSEPEYTAAMIAANPKIKEEAAKFSDKALSKKGMQVLPILDEDGNKVVCWKNRHNRPAAAEWIKRFRQEFLTKNFALNGEAFILGDTGSVLSGLKRGVGFILACQFWEKNPNAVVEGKPLREIWPSMPVYETVVSRGVRENDLTIRTLDNVQPRTDADTIFCSDVYANFDLAGKKECSRMLAKATDFLWSRTGFGAKSDDADKVFRTPSETAAFRERHKKLLQCVKHIYTENSPKAGRRLSLMKLSPGMISGILYLQGSASSDGEEYRAGTPPAEKGLKWDLWQKACEFWSQLAKEDSKEGSAVSTALGMLVDEDAGTGGRLSEKLAILARAWQLFAAGKKFNESDLELVYVEANGETKLDPDQNCLDFGGIDIGPGKVEEPEEEVPTETVEEAKARKRKEVEQEALENAKKAGVQGKQGAPAPTKDEQKAKLLQNRQERKENGKAVGTAAKPKIKPKR